ncbi:hypothetical protein A9Q86_12850 [Flavobacteriales bacterium 33_180_T64]|nr:hypothetical protein A9Q86_12850 [Flavobacteriales bacterium 33_180_T64]
MKKIIIILSVLSIISCSNENDSLKDKEYSIETNTGITYERKDAESTRRAKLNEQLTDLCHGQFFTIINSGNCAGDVFELCYCWYGVSTCICQYTMAYNQEAIEPYVNFLSENNFNDVQIAFNNVVESINTEGYDENVIVYKNTIDSLEGERKLMITNWLENVN